MSSWRPSFSVVPSPLISRTKAIPNGFSDLSRAAGKYKRGGRGESTMAPRRRRGLTRASCKRPLTVLGGSVSEHHPQVGAAHVLDGNRHLGEEREGVKQRAAGVRGWDYTWRRAPSPGRICMSGTFYLPQKINPACRAAANPGTCLLEVSSP